MADRTGLCAGLTISGDPKLGIGLLVFGLACGVTSTALDYWYYWWSATVQGHTSDGFFGLWETCVKVNNKTGCISWSFLHDSSGGFWDIYWLQACQAMMIIGAVLNAAACGAALYATMKRMPPRIAQVFAGICGVCYVTAVAIFGAKYRDGLFYVQPANNGTQNGGSLHWGFGLAIVAGFINLVSICVLPPDQQTASYQQI